MALALAGELNLTPNHNHPTEFKMGPRPRVAALTVSRGIHRVTATGRRPLARTHHEGRWVCPRC